MKFNYRKINLTTIFSSQKYILRPIIPVSLKYQNHSIRYEALVDSGADHNIFPVELGIKLGMDVKRGKLNRVSGISGDPFPVYFHKIEIEIGGWRHEVLAGFADHVNQSQGILGQYGFFNLFKVKFSLNKEEIEITLNNNLN